MVKLISRFLQLLFPYFDHMWMFPSNSFVKPLLEGCGRNSEKEIEEISISISTCWPPERRFTQEIGGDHIQKWSKWRFTKIEKWFFFFCFSILKYPQTNWGVALEKVILPKKSWFEAFWRIFGIDWRLLGWFRGKMKATAALGGTLEKVILTKEIAIWSILNDLRHRLH